jgi:hypothetical protein
MACFTVPATVALITTLASKGVQSKEKHSSALEVNIEGNSLATAAKIPFRAKLKWLTNLLWGGSALLAFEHLWHGEVVPWFPFLTAAGNPEDTAAMFHEMATIGVTMVVLVLAVWVGMLGLASAIEKRAAIEPQKQYE